MERLVRQALVSTIYGGTSEIQRNMMVADRDDVVRGCETMKLPPPDKPRGALRLPTQSTERKPLPTDSESGGGPPQKEAAVHARAAPVSSHQLRIEPRIDRDAQSLGKTISGSGRSSSPPGIWLEEIEIRIGSYFDRAT